MSTPIPESLIEWTGIAWGLPVREVSVCIFFGVTVSPVVVVLFDNGRDGERGRDVREFGRGAADMWESEVTEVEVVVAVVAFRSSGLSLEPESEGRVSLLEREREREEERERKP